MLTRKLNGMEQLERRDLRAAVVDALPDIDARAANNLLSDTSVASPEEGVYSDTTNSAASAKRVEEISRAIADLAPACTVSRGVDLGFDDSDAFIPAHPTGVVEHRYATLAPYETSLEIELLAEMRHRDGSDRDLWLHFQRPGEPPVTVGLASANRGYSHRIYKWDLGAFAGEIPAGTWKIRVSTGDCSAESTIFVGQAGDANMDGIWDTTDMVQALAAGRYWDGTGTPKPANWTQGDFNGDGIFDRTDLVAALEAGPFNGQRYAITPADVGHEDFTFRKIRDLPYGDYVENVGDLYLPVPLGDAQPSVVVIHGGGWVQSDKDVARERNLAGFLADNGYVAYSINYRLGHVWPDHLLDGRDAVRFLRENAVTYRLNGLVGAMGGSAGGHLATMLAVTDGNDFLDNGVTADSGRVEAAVNFAGPMDLVAWDMNVPPLLPNPRDEQQQWDASPVKYATDDDSPVFTVHGTADTTVNYDQAALIDGAMADAGAPHTLLTLSGQKHTIKLDSPVDIRPDIRSFLSEHLLP